MGLIDELYTARPFFGSRQMRGSLRLKGFQINRKRVQRLMRKMGLVSVSPKPGTSKAAPGHRIYPYLLRKLAVVRRYYVHPPCKGGCVFGGSDGLGQPQGLELGAQLQPGGKLLLLGLGAGWPAGELQHRSRRSVHRSGLHRAFEGEKGADQHGQQGTGDGQHLCGTTLEKPEIR